MNSRQVRITRAEALELLRRAPLLELGRRAFEAKRARHGDRITFVQNRHVNPTNLCVLSCRFCDFSAKRGDAHAYELTEDEILDDLSSPHLTEAHIVGGLWPKWGFERSLGLIRRIRATYPHISVKAFTAVEVAYFAHMERQDVDTILHRMLDAGIELMPGGGAEVLSERVHKELYKDKIGPDEWLAIHERAHRLGIPSNASILFGHIETDEEIVDHLFALRELQDRTAGFVSFIPLVYQPGDSGLVRRMVSAPRSLRVVALSRLVLDNIPHIKAYWPVLGEETAVAALNFGADDMDGTLGKERIMQLAGSDAPESQSAEHMARLIRLAGQEPAERDGRFGLVNREPATAVEC